MIALSAGVLRKLPPSASPGANAIACRMPSTRPQRSRRSSATASMSSGLLTSSSSTSGAGSSLARRAVGHALGAAEAGQDDLGPGRLRLLGDLVRDRLAVDDAGDQELLALQGLTAGSFLLRMRPGHSRRARAGHGRAPGGLQARARRCARRSRTRGDRERRRCRRCPAAWPSRARSRGRALLRLLEIERRRGDPVAQREDRRHRLHGARGAEQVPDRGLRATRPARSRRGRRAPS